MEYRIYHTIKEIVKHAEDTYGSCDAVRYKTGKDTIEAKTYRQIGKDSRSFFRCEFENSDSRARTLH